jgi:hypothetical protein
LPFKRGWAGWSYLVESLHMMHEFLDQGALIKQFTGSPAFGQIDCGCPDQIDFMQFVPVSATSTLIREIAYVHPDRGAR